MTGALTIGVSARTVDRHVGGNTTYVREVYARLPGLGVHAVHLRPPGGRRPRVRALHYAAYEALALQEDAKGRGCAVAHYPADTGPVRRAGGVRTAVTLHGVGTLAEPDIRGRWAGRVWLARARRAAHSADLVITVSESSRRGIVELAGEAVADRIAVVPHGVDGSVFRPAAPDQVAAVTRRHGLRGPFVLFVGNLEPRKNLISLVQAMRLLQTDMGRIELAIVGAPAWDAQPTLDAIAASPDARRLGRLPDGDLPALMTACTALVLPSRYEGFGLPVLEAMACGAPVVCTRRGALPEVAGDAATYADDVTPEAIAEAIRRSAGTPREHWSRLGRDRALGFSWQASAERHRVEFERLARG